MKLINAETIATELVEMMRPFCERVEIAGSIRRRKAEVKDIEIVCIPKWEQQPDPTNLFGELIDVNLLHQWATKQRRIDWIKPGTKEIELWHISPDGKYWRGLMGVADGNAPMETIKLDVFIARPENWGVIFTIRTGSRWFSQALVTYAKQQTFYRVGDGVLKRDNSDDMVECREEAELFKRLHLVLPPPEEREYAEAVRPVQIPLASGAQLGA